MAEHMTSMRGFPNNSDKRLAKMPMSLCKSFLKIMSET